MKTASGKDKKSKREVRGKGRFQIDLYVRYNVVYHTSYKFTRYKRTDSSSHWLRRKLNSQLIGHIYNLQRTRAVVLLSVILRYTKLHYISFHYVTLRLVALRYRRSLLCSTSDQLIQVCFVGPLSSIFYLFNLFYKMYKLRSLCFSKLCIKPHFQNEAESSAIEKVNP